MENKIIKILVCISRLSEKMGKMCDELDKLYELLQDEEFLKLFLRCDTLSKEDYD